MIFPSSVFGISLCDLDAHEDMTAELQLCHGNVRIDDEDLAAFRKRKALPTISTYFGVRSRSRPYFSAAQT